MPTCELGQLGEAPQVAGCRAQRRRHSHRPRQQLVCACLTPQLAQRGCHVQQ